jgi:hypothetical protein
VKEIMDILGTVIFLPFSATIRGGESLLTGAGAFFRGFECPNSVILNIPKVARLLIMEMEQNVFLQGFMMIIILLHKHWSCVVEEQMP